MSFSGGMALDLPTRSDCLHWHVPCLPHLKVDAYGNLSLPVATCVRFKTR